MSTSLMYHSSSVSFVWVSPLVFNAPTRRVGLRGVVYPARATVERAP